MKTVPTLLTTTNEEFVKQIELFQKYYSRLQLDIADGILVPNKTTQIEDIASLIREERIIIDKKTVFDFHLMVKDFDKELEKIARLQELQVHVNVALVNAALTPHLAKLAESYTFSIGLDVSPTVEVADLARQYNLGSVSAIQIMTVTPGFQGSPFLPEMLNKITQLREQDYSGEILIDGGVNSMTIPVIQSSPNPPDVICIGSYLTKAGGELEERVKELKQ